MNDSLDFGTDAAGLYAEPAASMQIAENPLAKNWLDSRKFGQSRLQVKASLLPKLCELVLVL